MKATCANCACFAPSTRVSPNPGSYSSSSFGWDPPQKRKELFDAQGRFVLACQAGTSDVVAYATFRFETEENIEGVEERVLYCYELQVSQRLRRSGLGSALMSDLECIAKRWGMRKVMLTCFLGAFSDAALPRAEAYSCNTANIEAMTFYKRVGSVSSFASAPHPDHGGRFKEDPISPSQVEQTRHSGSLGSPPNGDTKEDEWEDEEEEYDYEILSKEVLSA